MGLETARQFESAYKQALARSSALNEIRRKISLCTLPDSRTASAELEDAFMRISTAGQYFQSTIEGYELRRTQASENYRAFQAEHGLRRPAIRPDTFMAIYVVAAFAVLEGTAAGFLMVGEGHTDFIVGIALGLIFGFLNVLVAVAGGFFGLRNIFWKTNAPYQDTQDAARRGRGKQALTASLLVLALLLWTAMRTRALGSHQGIFSFSEVGVFETVNDGLSIALLVLGALGGMFGYYKGYCGFSDPVPGYTKALRDVEDVITAEVADAAQEAEDNILDIAEDAEEAAEQALEACEAAKKNRDELSASYEAARNAHHDAIALDILRLKSAQSAIAASRKAIARRDVEPERPLDLDALESLTAPELTLSGAGKAQSQPANDLNFHLNAVRDAKMRALADIRQCVIAFEANTPDLSPIE